MDTKPTNGMKPVPLDDNPYIIHKVTETCEIPFRGEGMRDVLTKGLDDYDACKAKAFIKAARLFDGHFNPKHCYSEVAYVDYVNESGERIVAKVKVSCFRVE